MAIQTYTKEYLIQTGVNDGYIEIDTNSFDNTDIQSWLGYNNISTTGNCDFFTSFSNVDIPKYANILSAKMALSVYYTINGYVDTKFYMNTKFTIPSTYNEFIEMEKTTEFIEYKYEENYSPHTIAIDVRDMLQEIISLDTWKLGNNVTMFTSDTVLQNSNSSVNMDTYEYIQYTKLTVIYEIDDKYTFEGLLKRNRTESFYYQLISLVDGVYSHKDDITKYVSETHLKINFNSNVIGTANFTINNNANIDYLNDLIKIHYIVEGYGINYTIPLGVFTLLAPNKKSNGVVVHRQVQGFDLLKVLEDDKTTTSTSYTSGTNVVTAIKTLLDGVGSWVSYNIEDSSQTLNEDMTYEQGRSKLYIINGFLKTINYYPLWCTGNGIFKSIPWTETQTIAWNFLDDNEGLYNKTVNTNIDYANMYNKVIIITAELVPDSDPITSIATFEDYDLEDHPYSYTNIGRYVTKIFRSEAVSQTYADLRAKREIYKMLEVNEEIDYRHAFVTSRQDDGLPYQGDCYLFKNDLLGLNNIYKIDSFTWNLKTGSLVTSKIRRFADIG